MEIEYEAEPYYDYDGYAFYFYGDGLNPQTNWSLGDEIGGGGFGTVFEVNDHGCVGLDLAVKQMRISIHNKEKNLKAFRTETSILSRIRHTRIIEMFGFSVTDNTLSIFMEKIKMGSLEDYLYKKSNPNLLEAEIRQITRQLLEGLSYLHSAWIIHRDIKGANVLLEDKFNVKLTDFGTSKLMLSNSMNLTSNVGTLRFMAPEMLITQPYSNKVDIWSLGCTVIQMINRNHPFDDRPEYQMVYFKLSSEDPSPAYCVKTNCSQYLKEFINLALNKDPQKRPTADQLLNEHRFLASMDLGTNDASLDEKPKFLNDRFEDCVKHPGHTQFIPIDDFDIGHLHNGYQDKDIVDLVKAIAEITLQITVNSDGHTRAMADQSCKQSTKAGTGYVHRVDLKKNSICKCHTCQISETPSMEWWEVVVITSTSVVCDVAEVQNAICRAFFDKTTSPPATIDGVSSVEINMATQRCTMKCATCNKDLIDIIKKRMEEAETLRGKVMQQYMHGKDDHKLAIIISHPHGFTKHVTVGNWVERFESGVDQTKYTYTTPTCPGSSGGPVFILSRIDNKGYHTHSGVDKGINISGTWVG